jgi:hypothetical protein
MRRHGWRSGTKRQVSVRTNVKTHPQSAWRSPALGKQAFERKHLIIAGKTAAIWL